MTLGCWYCLVGLFCTAFMTSCSLVPTSGNNPPQPVLFQWSDESSLGELHIEIDLAKQIATYKRGERSIGWSFVSTGREGHATRPGSYTITEKMPVKYSDRYGWIADATGKVTNGDAKPTTPVPPGETYFPSPMHSWMRITSYGVGLHAGEIPKPGEPASHGCIRLPREFVPILYEATKIGTPVRIVAGKSRPTQPMLTASMDN